MSSTPLSFPNHIDSNYVKIVPDSSVNRTYVIFSSVDISPGDFMFWRIMQSIPGSKIFINDELNGWYVHGIPSLGRKILDSARALCTLISSTQPKEVVFLGVSMGGYGAMLYGSIISKSLNPAVILRCLSFGGEFLLYEQGTRSLALTKKKQNHKCADIRPIIKKGRLNIVHIYGDMDENDNYQASLAHGIDNVKIVSVSNSPHAVSYYIGKNFDIINFIRTYGETGTLLDLPYSKAGGTKEFGRNVYFGHLDLVNKNYKIAQEKLSIAIEHVYDNAMAHHKLGIAFLMTGDYKKAFSEQSIAISLNKNLANAYFHQGLIFTKTGAMREAIKAYGKCCDIDYGHIKSRFELAKYYIHEKNFIMAEKNLYALLSFQPKNTIALQMLQGVLSRHS